VKHPPIFQSKSAPERANASPKKEITPMTSLTKSGRYLNQLLQLPSVVYALLSPDGRWVAFAWYHRHNNMDVFAVPTDGSAPPLALTHTPEYTWLVGWLPDSSAVVIEQDHDGDEHVRLFRVDLANPGMMHALTDDHPPYFTSGGSLHPDGRHLFYGANFDFSTGTVLEPTWIYRHDLLTGERAAIARPEKPVDMQVSLNLQGTHLLYCRKDRHPSGRQFHLVDVNGDLDQEFLNFGDQVKTFARWFPDGENILVLSEATGDHPQQHLSLGVYNRISRQLRWLVDDPARFIEGAWVSPDGTIIADEIIRASHAPGYIEPGDTQMKPLPRLPGNLLLLGRAADDAWVAMYYAAHHPTDLVRFDPGATGPGDLVSLTRVWELTELEPGELAPTEPFSWHSVDGLEVWGWLYRARPNPRRAVIFIHGGPSYHSEDRLNAQIQYLVERGFNVLDVNYRGSTGYGLMFREAIKVDGWGGREQADVASGAQALIQAGLADAGRIGVTGTSYGGYCCWHLITHYPPEVIAAAAPICGMTDLVVDYESTRPDLRPLSEEMIGGRPDQIPEKYTERSPINFVQNIRGNLLIVQGGRDPNVTPENVSQVRQRLDRYEIPYELLVFLDEGHGIYRQDNQARLYRHLADFFDRSL
jgi:dienelactone hydrolase